MRDSPMSLIFGTIFVIALAFWVILWELIKWATNKLISKKGSK